MGFRKKEGASEAFRPKSKCNGVCPSVPSRSPGRDAEVFLDEVAGDGQRQEGDEEDGGHVGDDAQGGHTQQGGAGEALQRGGDVLVDRVCVCGEPVEDAAEGSRLKQPEGMKAATDQDLLKVNSVVAILNQVSFNHLNFKNNVISKQFPDDILPQNILNPESL